MDGTDIRLWNLLKLLWEDADLNIYWNNGGEVSSDSKDHLLDNFIRYRKNLKDIEGWVRGMLGEKVFVYFQ